MYFFLSQKPRTRSNSTRYRKNTISSHEMPYIAENEPETYDSVARFMSISYLYSPPRASSLGVSVGVLILIRLFLLLFFFFLLSLLLSTSRVIANICSLFVAIIELLDSICCCCSYYCIISLLLGYTFIVITYIVGDAVISVDAVTSQNICRAIWNGKLS